jgi:hypothetical protein
VERDIAHRTTSYQKKAANKLRFIMLSKKTRNLVRSVNILIGYSTPSCRLRSYGVTYAITIYSKAKNLNEMGVRDSGGSDVIFSSEELSIYYSSLGEDDAPMDRSQGHLRSPVAMKGYFLFPMLLTGRFLMQSVELNMRRWDWTEFQLGSFG